MILGINPYLVTDGNGQEAVAFYEQALDAKILGVQTFGDLPDSKEFQIPVEAKHRIVHAHLKVGNTDLMISDTFPGPHEQPYQIGTHVAIAITINDVFQSKEVFKKLQEDGQVVMPLQETHFSPSYGQVTDKFGVTWHVSTHATDDS